MRYTPAPSAYAARVLKSVDTPGGSEWGSATATVEATTGRLSLKRLEVQVMLDAQWPSTRPAPSSSTSKPTAASAPTGTGGTGGRSPATDLFRRLAASSSDSQPA